MELLDLISCILEEIFGYLDLSSLKSLILVSQKFATIIKTSSRIGWNFSITITNERNGPPKVHIPIKGLKYKHLIIKGHSSALDSSNEGFEDIFNHQLQDYLKDLRKATFDNFTSNYYVNLRLRHIKHLVITQRDELSPCAMNKHENWNCFDDLNKLEIDVDSIHSDLVASIRNRLTHLKFYMRGKMDHEVFEEFSMYLLDHQNITLQDLKLRGVTIKECPVQSIVNKNHHLRSLELELDQLTDNEDLLATIKSPGYAYYNPLPTWRELVFKNIDKHHANIVNRILANHLDIEALKLEYEQPHGSSFIAGIPNLKKIHFTFGKGMERSFENFSTVDFLEIYRVDNNAQIMKLIDLLHRCNNLKILKLNLISSRAHLTPRIIKLLLAAVKNLEQLYLDAYSDRLEISPETFGLIKTDAKKLKKFTLSVDERKVGNFREHMKVFNDTSVHAITLGKIITPTSLESIEGNLRIEPAVCVWKK